MMDLDQYKWDVLKANDMQSLLRDWLDHRHMKLQRAFGKDRLQDMVGHDIYDTDLSTLYDRLFEQMSHLDKDGVDDFINKLHMLLSDPRPDRSLD